MYSKTIYSKDLETEITITVMGKDAMTAKTKDGCFYNTKEMYLLSSRKIKTPKKIHLLKKIFNGEIVKVT